MIRLELCVGKPTRELTLLLLFIYLFYKTQNNKGH